MKVIRNRFNSFVRFLLSSRKTILLILITAIITLILSGMISIWLNKTINLHIPSLGNIQTLGVQTYWDISLKNKTETVDWGTIQLGVSNNVTLYIQSISNFETTLHLNATNWDPPNISNYMSLSWNYNGTTIYPDEIIQVTLTLTASSSNAFLIYLINSDIKQFSFNIVITTLEIEG